MLAVRGRYVLPLLLVLTIGAGLAPIAPSGDSAGVARTTVHRLDHRARADFAGGVLSGAAQLLGSDAEPRLTLTADQPGAYVSPPLRLDLAATTLAAHWQRNAPGGPDVTVAVRASPDATTWTDWYELEAEGGTTDERAVTVFGSPVAVDQARYAQYRVSLSAGMWAGSHSISRSMSGWSSVWAALYWRTQRLICRS